MEIHVDAEYRQNDWSPPAIIWPWSCSQRKYQGQDAVLRCEKGGALLMIRLTLIHESFQNFHFQLHSQTACLEKGKWRSPTKLMRVEHESNCCHLPTKYLVFLINRASLPLLAPNSSVLFYLKWTGVLSVGILWGLREVYKWIPQACSLLLEPPGIPPPRLPCGTVHVPLECSPWYLLGKLLTPLFLAHMPAGLWWSLILKLRIKIRPVIQPAPRSASLFFLLLRSSKHDLLMLLGLLLTSVSSPRLHSLWGIFVSLLYRK
jgi:hypothetical protein